MIHFITFRFVGLTIQKTGLLNLQSGQNDENDKWRIEIYKGSGLGARDGVLTVEGGGQLEARNLDLYAYKCEVDVDGWINLDRKGFNAGLIDHFIYKFPIQILYKKLALKIVMFTVRNKFPNYFIFLLIQKKIQNICNISVQFSDLIVFKFQNKLVMLIS